MHMSHLVDLVSHAAQKYILLNGTTSCVRERDLIFFKFRTRPISVHGATEGCEQQSSRTQLPPDGLLASY
jgi:hypothetical protein